MPTITSGVDSRELDRPTIDQNGNNAGLYERAIGHEVRADFHRLLEEDLLPTSRVRFLGLSDYLADAGASTGCVRG